MKYMNNYSINQVKHDIEMLDTNTLTPNKDVENSSIHQGLELGFNVYFNCHQDKGFKYCAVALHTMDEDNYEHDVVAYFAFPNLGLEIPLRPRDQLFFNSDEPRMASSRCRNVDEVYCV